MLIPRADWRDDYHYAPDGTLTGWTRTRGDRQRRLRRGGRAHPRPGRPATRRRASRRVAYPLGRLPDGGLGIEEISAPR